MAMQPQTRNITHCKKNAANELMKFLNRSMGMVKAAMNTIS